MVRLITAYRKLPSPTNRRKLQAHLDKHPMAVCILGPTELDFLRRNEFKL